MLWFIMLFLPTVYASCGAGKYQPTSAEEGKSLDSCYDCPAGYHRSDINRPTCRECGLGKYQDIQGAIKCKNCPDGYAQTVGNQKCIQCSAGRFLTPLFRCADACPDGSWNVDSVCQVCQAGKYSERNSDVCKPCAVGYFKYGPSTSNCSQCPSGFISITSKQSCTQCEAGTQPNITDEVCNQCVAGQYENNNICEECAPGRFSMTKQTMCTQCEAGQYQTLRGQASCSNCPVGTFSNVRQRACTTCPTGYGVSSEGASACVLCTGAETVNGQCVTCNAGMYDSGPRCSACPLGYASNDGASQCTICPMDTYSDDGILNANGLCKLCTKSQGSTNIMHGPGSWKCCISGCSDCPAGTYRDENKCSSCPLGFFSNSASDRCTACIAREGEYADSVKSTECKACAEGYDSTGSECLACGPGTSEFMFDCLDCPRGWYSSSEVNPDCTRCAPQKTTLASASNAASACGEVTCKTNEIVDEFGKCQVCGGGKYVDGYHCKECPLGYFKNTPEDQDCTVCPPRFNTETTGQLNCFMCPPGETCGCPWGQYGPDKDTCTDCPVGFFSKGNAECTACSAHTYQDEEGKGGCKSCPAGRFGDTVGSASCKECAAGTFQKFTASGACDECTRGRYSSTGQIECTNCTAGTSTISEKSTVLSQCHPCPIGTMESDHLCMPCHEGQYQNEPGTKVCKQCPARKWSAPGTKTESECFSMSGLVTYTFGNVQDSKEDTEFTTLCELRPNFIMLCPACTCDADSRNGFWGGPLCNECERGFATRFCTSICPGYDGRHDSTICNGNGRCWFGRQGTGICYCGGKDEIDSSAENVFVDTRYCPAGQICPGYGVEKVAVMKYIPLYYLLVYRQFTSFVLQMTQYTPQRGHMWFKRFSPAKAFENTCTQCTSKFSDSVMTSVGHWNNDNEYGLFPNSAQSPNGFHGENCQHECAVCLNGGSCVHSPHPYRYTYTIEDTFQLQKAITVPTTACLCTSNVFDASHMCCPNGFQPYVYYGKRGTTPYTRMTTVPHITSVDNDVARGYYIDKDLLLEPGFHTPYAEPENGFIAIAQGRQIVDDVGIFRDIGPYNKHVYHGTTKEICRACPGLFGKGVRAVERLIKTEQEAEEYWWNFPASAGSKKCQGQGVCDFYADDKQIDVDFMGNVNDWALLHRGTLCINSIEGRVGIHKGERITTLEQCVEYGLSLDANYVGWAPVFYRGGTDEDMMQDKLGAINYGSSETAENIARSSFSPAWAKKEGDIYAVVDKVFPRPDSDSPYLVYPRLEKKCVAYEYCPEVRPITATTYRPFNVYTIERGRGDERMDGATFDRFDTCFTYTKNYDHDPSMLNNRQKFGLYFTQNYEQGDDPFIGGLCPRGHFCSQNSQGVGFKEACPVGYYQPHEGQTRTGRDVHCSRVTNSHPACQENLATKNSTDFVDRTCKRCSRDSYAPAGSYECTQCPPGRVKKVSGRFDPSAVDVYNIPTMSTPYWFYIPNEGGTMLDDCAIVPASVVHVPSANEKMTETDLDDQYLPVVSCPFGYSSRPGSYVIEDIWNMKSILQTDRNAMVAPYIYIDGDIQVIASSVPCDCLTTDEKTTYNVPVSAELCEQYSTYLSEKGTVGNVRGITKGLWYGCIKYPHSSWVQYNDNDNVNFNYPSNVKFICQRVVQEKTLIEEFVSSYCYECPGDSMTGPGSGICTTCTANLIKTNMKQSVQKLVSNSQPRMFHCDNSSQAIASGTKFNDPRACPFQIIFTDVDMEITADTCNSGSVCDKLGQVCTLTNTGTMTTCCQHQEGLKWTNRTDMFTFRNEDIFCSVEEVECKKYCTQLGNESFVTPMGYCICSTEDGQITTDCVITEQMAIVDVLTLPVNNPNCLTSTEDGTCAEDKCKTISMDIKDTIYDVEYGNEVLAWYFIQQEDRIWPAQHVFSFIQDPSIFGANVEVSITDCILACSTVFDKTYDIASDVRRVRVGYARNTEERSFCMCNEGNPQNTRDAVAVAVDSDPSPGTYCNAVQLADKENILSGNCTTLGDLKVTWYESSVVDDWAKTEYPLCGLCAPGKRFTGSSCENCAQGQFTADMEQSMRDVCRLCPKGFFQEAVGSNGCRECRPGLFASLEAMPTCKECVPGQHQDEFKMPACKNCPSGYQQDDHKGVICKICPVGRYEPSTRNDTHVNDDECKQCPKGYYEDERGSSFCNRCERGRFQTDNGETSCNECAFGKFMATEAQPTTCENCPRGFHQDERGQPDCKTCRGTNADIQCPTGDDCLWKPSDGAVRTDAAGDAKYAAQEGMQDCVKCQAAYFCQVDAPQTPCATGSAMPPGWYSQQCYECNGAYYANPDRDACIKCTQPSIIDATRSACSACLATQGKIAKPTGCGIEPFDIGCNECFQCGIHEKSEGNACVKCCKDGEKCTDPFQDKKDGTKCSDCESAKFYNGEACQSCPKLGWKELPDDGTDGRHWYITKHCGFFGCSLGKKTNNKEKMYYKGPKQSCCWSNEDYVAIEAWVVTGEDAGTLTVSDSDDYVDIKVDKIFPTGRNILNKKYTYASSDETTDLDANSIFKVRWTWKNTNLDGIFEVSLKKALAYKEKIEKAPAQVYRKCT